MIAAGTAGTAAAGGCGLAIRAEGFLRANAPVRRGLDRIAVDRIQVSGFWPHVHPFMAQVRTMEWRNVPRCQFGMGHGHTTFIPAAFRIARLTAVRAIWTLYAF